MKKDLKLVNILGDVLLITGVGLVSYGAYKIYNPLGFITLGGCFIAFAFFMGLKGAN